MGHYDFQKDLGEAQKVEKEVGGKLLTYFPNITNIKYSATKGFDIECEIGSVLKKFEVKNELMVNKTGNVAIEYTSRGNHSGIITTTADYWVEKIKGEFFLIEVNELKKRITNKEYDDNKCGGDPGSQTCFYLVKEMKFKSWCKKM